MNNDTTINIENVEVNEGMLKVLDSVIGPKHVSSSNTKKPTDGSNVNINEVKFFINGMTDINQLAQLKQFVDESIQKLKINEENMRARHDDFYKGLKF